MVTRRDQIKANISRQSLLRTAMDGARQSSEILGQCGICGQPIFKRFKHPHSFSASIDHKVPLARGGTNALSNLQLAHLGCNTRKQDSLPGESPLARALRRRASA
jgi:5-methylcytosine-specific restriction endonuclease McrA